MTSDMWQLPWVAATHLFCRPLSSTGFSRDLRKVTVRTESGDLPARRATSVDHRHGGDHAPRTHRHCLSAENQPASPSAVPQAVVLRGPYFSGFLLIVKNIIDMKELITPQSSNMPRRVGAYRTASSERNPVLHGLLI
jgi:hypothetical protein